MKNNRKKTEGEDFIENVILGPEIFSDPKTFRLELLKFMIHPKGEDTTDEEEALGDLGMNCTIQHS